MLRLLVTAMLVAMATAQGGCKCSPEKYEATFLTQVLQAPVNGTPSLRELSMQYSYDRSRGMDVIMDSQGGSLFRSYYFFHSGVTISANPFFRTCAIVKGTAQDRGCVPETANVLGSWKKSNGGNAKVYQFPWDESTLSIEINDRCMPTASTTYGKNTQSPQGGGLFTVSTIGNHTIGIKNSSVFDIPDYCNFTAPLSGSQCCSPYKKYELSLFQQYATAANGTGNVQFQTAHVATDIEAGLEASLVQPGDYRIVTNRKTKTRYVMYPGGCTKTNDPDISPATNCIPADAQKLTDFVNVNGDKTTVYSLAFDGRNVTMQMDDKCNPLISGVFGKGAYIAQAFGQVLPGIKDETIFNVPASCL